MAGALTRRYFLKTAGAAVATALAPVRWAWADADPFVRLDATAQAELVRAGEVTPLELVDAAIARIERLNPVLNAFVTTCFDRAREQARGALPDGPFRGVPYAIKDLSDYQGTRATMGSRLFEDNISKRSNGIVERALEAGLVILGKTNTPEFGLLSTTESELLGPARNPWNLEHSTGGSSGGAAAAVASGMLPCAQASDGGGSIRIPSSACGVFGLKPSRGRIFRTSEALPGDIAVRFGVSRTVRDSARLLAASELRDAPALAPVGFVEGPSTRRLRIGFATVNAKGEAADPEVQHALEATAMLCEALGHTVVEAALEIDGDEFEHHFLSVWASLPARLEANAWLIGLTQLRWVGAEDVLEPWTRGLAKLHEERGADSVAQAVAYFQQIAQAYDRFFEQHDIQLTPVLREPPIRLGEQAPGVPFEALLAEVVSYASHTPPQNAAGTPAMSVPLSLSSAGLPIGSQFTAQRGGERSLLELAYELEQAQPWADRWPPDSAL
ncbi:MAG: amidase [Myxococcota bacterium]|nr:amidase [Myxococcota bacterium]